MAIFATTIKEKIFCDSPNILIDHAKIATEVYKENPTTPIELKRAMVFKRKLEEMPIFIRKGEFIVGSEGENPGDAQFFPEFSVDWLNSQIDSFELREDNSRFLVKPEVKESLRESISFWNEKSVSEWVKARLPEETKMFIKEKVFASVSGLYYDIGHVMPGYEKVLKYGFAGILSELDEKLKEVDISDINGIKKILFYNSAKITCEAAISFAQRYAEEAEKLYKLEKNNKRRSELKKISKICNYVPKYPARSFHEAIQAFWFTHLMVILEAKGMGISPGRFDQYMYPYFKNDIDNGVLTVEKAEEILRQLWLKFNEINYVLDSRTGELIGGYPSRQNLVLGGQTAEGKDAVNELSFLCLKATKDIGLPQPSLSLRYHNGISEKFLRESCRLISTGIGLPAIYNDEVDIPALLNRGIAYNDALDFGLVGCVELAIPGKSWMNPAGSKFNLLRCLQLTMNGGKSPDTKYQVGLKCKDLKDYKSFDELFLEYKRQITGAVKHLVVFENLIDSAHAELIPCPFLSCLVEDCISKGLDVKRGGAKYNFTGPQGVGLANSADALAAIKKLVFEKKVLSTKTLKVALDCNFENLDNVRDMLLNDAPKFGNDDDDVDLLAREVMDCYAKNVALYSNPRNGKFHAGMFPATANVSFGKVMGATPDGRKKGEPLADAISPAQGRDKKGITAVLKSVTKLNHIETSNGTLLNQKIHPLAIKNEKGIENLSSLIRGYCDMKGMEIQFNVIDGKTLREAQLHPEKYRSLVVRVAGWSALFTGLNKDVQDEIIQRTEQMVQQ